MKHCLCITHIIEAAFGGAETVVQTLAHTQHLQGHDVLCVLILAASNRHNVDFFIQAGIPHVVVEKKQGVLPCNVDGKIRMARCIAAELRPRRQGIVHLHLPLAAQVGRVADLMASCPYVVETIHGYADFYTSFLWKRFLFPLMRRSTKQFFCVSASLQERMRQVAKISSAVIPNAMRLVDCPLSATDARRALHIPEDAFVVGYCGRLEPEKNVTTLLRAMAHVPDALLVIIGDGSLMDALRRQSADMGIAPCFVGMLPNAARYFKAFDVLCLPSLHEAQGLVLLEAIALHVPVIGSNTQGIAETLEHGRYGLLHDPLDFMHLAEHINFVKHNRASAIAKTVLAHKKLSLTLQPQHQAQLYAEGYSAVLHPQKPKEALSRLKHAVATSGYYATFIKARAYVKRVLGRVRRMLLASSAVPPSIPFRGHAPLCVIIDHDAGGGATAYRQRMTESLLQQGHAVLLWQYMVGVGGYLFTWRLQQKVRTFRARHLEQALLFIEAATPEKIFFNNMAGWPRLGDTLQGVVNLCRGSTQLEIFLHDYFMLCPAYQLLDVSGAFCGVPSDMSRCDTCLPCQISAMAHRDTRIEKWRAMWAPFLDKAQCIIAPDASVQALFDKVYPNSAERILIVPHSPLCDWLPLPEQKIKKEAVVGVIGNITRPKGAGLVEDLVRLMEQQAVPMRVVVIGVLESSLRHPLLHVTGTYNHDDLPDLLIKHGVSACLVPSPLPETFCYVAQEIEMLGLPLVCLDLGAQAVRARNYVKGLIAPTPDAAGCLQSLRNLHSFSLSIS